MATNVNQQVWTRFRGEDISIVLTGEDSTDPSGWTLVAEFSVAVGVAPTLSVTPTVSGSGPYVITIPLTRAQTGTTLAGPRWFVSVWRTDSGSDEQLAGGTLYLNTPVHPLPT